jgi:hypothetical protein
MLPSAFIESHQLNKPQQLLVDELTCMGILQGCKTKIDAYFKAIFNGPGCIL